MAESAYADEAQPRSVSEEMLAPGTAAYKEADVDGLRGLIFAPAGALVRSRHRIRQGNTLKGYTLGSSAPASQAWSTS